MRYLDLTLVSPSSNLALDEALLINAASQDPSPSMPLLRTWESDQTIVVVGRGSHVEAEVELHQCRGDDVPVLRRCSGGAAIVAGPGCLMYALILPRSACVAPGLSVVESIHREVLQRIATALSQPHVVVRRSGISDLVIDSRSAPRKVSGNSLRIHRDWLLYHGTCLYDFPLGLVSRYLRMPPRMPDYRAARTHEQFLANLPMTKDDIKSRLCEAFKAHQPVSQWPEPLTRQLVEARYATEGWNLKL